MKKTASLALLCALTLTLCACAPGGAVTPTPEPTPTPGPFVFTPENMPVIDGSTATIPLIGAVHSVLLGIPREEGDAMVATSGTDNAYYHLIDGAADLLLVYSPAQSSLDYAAELGVELEMAPIGRDALVFLVNRQNPVESLTHAQLVGIYAGALTSWSEVGGEDAPIKAYQRPLRSGSQTMMDALVMQGVEMGPTESEYVISEMGGLVDAVAAYDNTGSAIGYNVYYYVSRMKLDDNVRLLSVGGVAPSKESISAGDYPFVSDFYVVIRGDAPEGSPERLLFDWMQSPDGQALVDHEGYATAGN